jgi:hypothetical protein
MLSISAGQIVEIVSKEGNGQYIFSYSISSHIIEHVPNTFQAGGCA